MHIEIVDLSIINGDLNSDANYCNEILMKESINRIKTQYSSNALVNSEVLLGILVLLIYIK